MDTSWINLSTKDPAYKEGAKNFVELARENLVEGKTRCPCKRCKVDKWLPIEEVEYHILSKGFDKSYNNWVFHGKGDIFPRMMGRNISEESGVDIPRLVDRGNMRGMLNAAFNVCEFTSNSPTESPNEATNDDGQESYHLPEYGQSSSHEPNQSETPMLDEEEEAKYRKLLAASIEALYEGCTSFSKLSFMLHLFHLKCMCHWSAESFTMLLKLLGDAFPQIMEFPSTYYEGKKMIKDLGLGYEKIHACPNNCILYWGEHSQKEECPVCHVSRWKTEKGKEGDTVEQIGTTKCGEAAKVMRYFPLIPRLKRLYMTRQTAEDMIWHHKDRVKDNKLRHPADGKAWIDFDARYPEFGADPRSVRLGLASDGFNPYRVMNTTFSTWPVVLIPYNLPPWLCMKPSSFILSIIVPRKSGPGNDIDVYLQPLMHELKLLWKGVNAFDAYSGKNFKLRATLRYTINDFPAYAMLSGWSTKGYKACPMCTNSTHSSKYADRICYMGHRKWLPDDHDYRSQRELFDGKTEYDLAPSAASGSDILRQQEGINYEYGKKTKKAPKKKRKRQDIGTSSAEVDVDCVDNDGDDDDVLWTKKSKLFDLPYWEHNSLRHNLDVMHIEKNVCDNLLGTLLNVDKKSRDDVKIREVLKAKGIKPHLWLQRHPNGELYMPPGSYIMSVEEKDRFLKVLRKVRVPDGYGSNISRCINAKQRKLSNLKTHDNHVLMQDILPVALRASRATKIIDLISDLSGFFKYLCSPTIDLNELNNIQSKITLTLCRMEMEFVPTFFTVMVHLLIHLVEEVRLGGPVHYRWMYPIERYLAHLKTHVGNKAQPDGSIAEGHILEETITFCSRYLEAVETMFNRPKRNDDDVPNMNNFLFNSGGRVVGKKVNLRLDDRSLKQAHRYVLLHTDEMKDLYNEFLRQKHEESHLRGFHATESNETEWKINEYPEWLQQQVHNIDVNAEGGPLMKALAGGLNIFATRMKCFMVNGYKFQTFESERYRMTQNSGVMVEGAEGQAYYGRLTDIYELDYFGAYRVVVFRCDWIDIDRGLRTYENGGACVNFSKLMHTGRFLRDDPFVFSSQAKQVFYVEDEM